MKQSIQYGIVWLLGIALMSPLFGWSQGLVTGTVSDESGMPLPGATVVVEETNAGTQNTDVMSRYDYYANPEGWTSIGAPHEMHVHDASFVKLRELRFGYQFTSGLIEKLLLTDASIAFVGRNLWIIHKNAPYTDPEAGISAGNTQGYQTGAYPAVKTYGLSLKLSF